MSNVSDGQPTKTFRDLERPFAKDINRLITSLHPTGKIVLQDGFEATHLNWQDLSNVGGSSVRDATRAFDGEASLKLTSSAVAWEMGSAYRHIGLPPSPRLGLEAWFATEGANVYNMQFELGWHDSVNLYTAVVFYNTVPREWYYINVAGNPVKIGDQWITGEYDQWHNVKFVADFLRREYISLVCDNMVFPIRGLGVTVALSAVTAHLTIRFYVFTRAAAAVTGYIDNVIVTTEEI
jgi:hypothetical protein